jgi:hypothetical protein
VFGHDHVADNDEGIALADLLQHSQKQVPTARSAKQALSTITTASDEVKVSSAVVAMQIVPHGHSIAPPRLRGGDVGHPPTVMKPQPSNPAGAQFSKSREGWRTPQFGLCDGSTTNSFLISGQMWPTRPTCTKESLSKQTRLRRKTQSLTRKSGAFVFEALSSQPYPISLAFSNQPMVIARSGGNNWGTSRLDSSIFIVKL